MSSKAKKLRKLAKKQAKMKKKPVAARKQMKRPDLWKKKTWFKIVAPKLFEEKEVGETLALKPTSLTGRIIDVPLKDITNKLQDMFKIIRLKVIEVKGKTAYTDFFGFYLVPDALRRNIRRHRSVISTILSLTTKDAKKIRLTAYVFTQSKTDTLKQKALRKVMSEYLLSEVPKENFLKIFEKSIYGELPSNIYKICKKYQKVKKAEIGKIKILP